MIRLWVTLVVIAFLTVTAVNAQVPNNTNFVQKQAAILQPGDTIVAQVGQKLLLDLEDERFETEVTNSGFTVVPSTGILYYKPLTTERYLIWFVKNGVLNVEDSASIFANLQIAESGQSVYRGMTFTLDSLFPSRIYFYTGYQVIQLSTLIGGQLYWDDKPIENLTVVTDQLFVSSRFFEQNSPRGLAAVDYYELRNRGDEVFFSAGPESWFAFENFLVNFSRVDGFVNPIIRVVRLNHQGFSIRNELSYNGSLAAWPDLVGVEWTLKNEMLHLIKQ